MARAHPGFLRIKYAKDGILVHFPPAACCWYPFYTPGRKVHCLRKQPHWRGLHPRPLNPECKVLLLGHTCLHANTKEILDFPKFKVALNLFQSVFLYSVVFTVVKMGVPSGRL